jgi:nucleoside-diphosphate-sugar epimerase
VARIFLTGGSGFIGAEIVRLATAQGHCVQNLDLARPRHDAQAPFWVAGDVRDATRLGALVGAFAPDIVIHLASDTDVQGTRIEQFTSTIAGTRAVLAAVGAAPGVRRFVHISTQFVVRPGVIPQGEAHFEPYTVYGEAKAQSERLVRQADLRCDWLIVRPTIIWGPGHAAFAANIFKYIATRAYLHPAAPAPILRAFGYVTNTAAQILTLALLPDRAAPQRVFYAGDATIDYDRWVDAFSLALTGKAARRIPLWLLHGLAALGDWGKAIGLRAPIDRGRAFRMTTSSAIDLSATLAITGEPEIGFDRAIEATVAWLKGERAAR